MAIFSDLELQHIMNEGSKDKEDLGSTVKDIADSVTKQAKGRKDQVVDKAKEAYDKTWAGKKNKVKFKEDKNGKVTECYIEGIDDDKYFNEGKNSVSAKNMAKKLDDTRISLTNTGTVAAGKEIQEWKEKPAEKALTTAADIATGDNVIKKGIKYGANLLGKRIDDTAHAKIVKKKEAERKAKNEEVDWRDVYRSPEYTRAMNEFFDITDRETRKVLLAVNEADQNKVLVSLTSKLYDNVVDRIDDIDFGEIERSKGDIEKIPNFETLHECLNNMARLLIEFKQDTKPVDTIAESVANIVESKPIWTKAYAVNAELPMITYNTITLAIIEATSYMVSMCVDFVKSPSQDTIQVMIDKSALTKSKGHMLFKNLESFNDAYNKGQVTKAMEAVISEVVSKKSIDTSKKNFLGFYMGGGVAVAAAVGVVGLLFCIIPIIRELIFLFFYYRVRISEFFDVQADLLQVNAYNVQNNRLDLTSAERKTISKKQMKVADDFRKIAKKIAVDGNQAEKSASKDIKFENEKKYKAEDIMDELPDSAASSSSLF